MSTTRRKFLRSSLILYEHVSNNLIIIIFKKHKNLSRNDFLFFLIYEMNNFTFTCVITFMCHSPVSLIVIQPSYHNSYIGGQFLILNHFLTKIYAKKFHYFGYFLKNLFCLIDTYVYSYCAMEKLYSYNIYHSQIE